MFNDYVDLLDHLETFLKIFGIDGKPERDKENNSPNVFPYNWEKNIDSTFEVVLSTREDYLHFLEEYLKVVHYVEPLQKKMKEVRKVPFAYWQSDAQAAVANIANVLTRIYWLRTMARRWRHNVCVEKSLIIDAA